MGTFILIMLALFLTAKQHWFFGALVFFIALANA
jgi:hypothetical protein